VPSPPNRDLGRSLPLAPDTPAAGVGASTRTELQFRGFPEFRSNVLYCPKQFFTVVVPHSSVNCIRVVAHMLRKTLGWVDENGDPLQERHQFTYREFEERAGVVHSGLQKAVDEALKAGFIRRAQRARIQAAGVQAKSASYELVWDEDNYTDDLSDFKGFYLQPSYLDQSGQNRIGRKNIPNIFFDYLIREENRALIRVVGTLLWYSIDWGKGGERRTTVRKSLRDLVELTQLAKGSVVRALDEAVEKGYIERVEPGVFDLAGNQQGSVTVYGIKWTTEYTYSPEGVIESIGLLGEHSKNETRLPVSNAPKMRHGQSDGTLQKRDTGEHSKNETRNAPKTRHGERSKNETIRITKTDIPNTSISNNSSSPAATSPSVAAAEEALLEVGFDKKTAKDISTSAPLEVILRQVASLPLRTATKNPLGMLRRAIEENWALPPEGKTTDVGSSRGQVFAASFYAGYHGNDDAPVSDPSPADSVAAEKFVSRLLAFWADPEQVDSWGRSFGSLVAYKHGKIRQSFPALRPAIQQHGDDFYSRLRKDRETKARQARELARSEHYEKFAPVYLDYLRAELARNEAANTRLFQTLVAEEAEKLKVLSTNRFGLNVKQLIEQYSAGRLERFQQMLIFEEGHGVLDFWQWDKAHNEESFDRANV
jgi:hypothetical protein